MILRTHTLWKWKASIDKVESSVIAYFSLNDEDFMIAFQSVSVNIISPSNLLYRIIVIFFVLVAILAYSTYLIYKEIKKNEKEIVIVDEHEELFNQPINIIL